MTNSSDPLGLSYVDKTNSSLPCTKDSSDPQYATAVVYCKRTRCDLKSCLLPAR